MKTSLTAAAVAATMLAFAGPALAQDNMAAPAAPAAPAPQAGAMGGAGAISITPDQQTNLLTALKAVNAPPATVDFTADVGATVPDTITLTPVPDAATQVVAQLQGYQFFATPEGSYVVVAPDTKEVALVIAG